MTQRQSLGGFEEEIKPCEAEGWEGSWVLEAKVESDQLSAGPSMGDRSTGPQGLGQKYSYRTEF